MSRHIDENPRDLVLERSSDSDGDDIERGTPAKQNGRRTPKGKNNKARSLSSENGHASNSTIEKKRFDGDAFLDKRVMTPNQERFNAITMIPGMVYTLYFILAGCWITACDRQDDAAVRLSEDSSYWAGMASGAFGDDDGWGGGGLGCVHGSELPYIMALPPLPVVAAAVGTLVHSPVSINYHWWYATSLDPSRRIEHWSRRLDHAFIHFSSACAAYATSGRVDFFLLNVAYNMDCAYRQFEEKVCPRRNLYRVASSIFLSVLPVLAYRHYLLFFQIFAMFAVSGWYFLIGFTAPQQLFVRYPVGGWSHGLFHLVLSFLPHLIMKVATQVESSQENKAWHGCT
ncbi:hypothetical protein ACHAW5_010262 [Stephanodiscus triporus]|uniref:Alkaline ceramidase n=1 Tax=Stephanodiscus triporus TaxID=2934178 RepID=A0ABD3N0N2_9STRA